MLHSTQRSAEISLGVGRSVSLFLTTLIDMTWWHHHCFFFEIWLGLRLVTVLIWGLVKAPKKLHPSFLRDSAGIQLSYHPHCQHEHEPPMLCCPPLIPLSPSHQRTWSRKSAHETDSRRTNKLPCRQSRTEYHRCVQCWDGPAEPQRLMLVVRPRLHSVNSFCTSFLL